MSGVFPAEVRTERLQLVREHPDDVPLSERYEALDADAISDAEVEYAGIRTFEHLGDAREYQDVRVAHWDDGNGAVYAIRPRADEPGAGELAGEAELSVDWETRRGHLSIALRKRFWGRGYSGERAGALLALAFDHLDLEIVGTAHAEGNENSRRAVETYVDRFGGHRAARTRNMGWLDGEPADLVRYTVTRDQYEMSDSQPTVTFDFEGGTGA